MWFRTEHLLGQVLAQGFLLGSIGLGPQEPHFTPTSVALFNCLPIERIYYCFYESQLAYGIGQRAL